MVGLLTDEAGSPLRCASLKANGGPVTVSTPIAILKRRFHVEEVVSLAIGGW